IADHAEQLARRLVVAPVDLVDHICVDENGARHETPPSLGSHPLSGASSPRPPRWAVGARPPQTFTTNSDSWGLLADSTHPIWWTRTCSTHTLHPRFPGWALTSLTRTSPGSPEHALDTGRIPVSKEKRRDRSGRPAGCPSERPDCPRRLVPRPDLHGRGGAG